MESVPVNSPLAPLVSIDPDRLHGEPVFRGTRVPIRTLFDYLARGHALAEFLDHFEGVTAEQAVGVMTLAAQGLLDRLGPARAA